MSSGEEARVHARIHIATQIRLAAPGGPQQGILRDLSLGGARVVVSDGGCQVGDAIQLFLPSLGMSEIPVEGQVVRVEATRAGMALGVRFDVIEPDMRDALIALIDELLPAAGGGRRAHPRVARRLEVRFGDLEELRGILEDISAGGLLMTVREPLVLFEELDVAVPDMEGGELLTLHARVMNQRAVGEGDALRYRVGLEFTRMRPEAALCVEALLRTVADSLAVPAEAQADDTAPVLVEEALPLPLPPPPDDDQGV